MPASRRTLRARIALGLLIYSVLLGAGMLLQGYLTNEHIEQVLWRTLLTQEARQFQERRAKDPGTPLPQSRSLSSFEVALDSRADGHLPLALRNMTPGLYDDVDLDGREVAVLVRDADARRLYIAVDIAGLEAAEEELLKRLLASSLMGLVVLVAAIWWLAGSMLRPISTFAAQFDVMSPEIQGERVEVHDSDSVEVATIASAMNRYLDRQESFVVRERAFINTMSHELRTPVAVMRGAAEIIGQARDLPEDARRPLSRIHHTLDNVEQLIAMLLVLARDADGFDGRQETIDLETLLPEIILAHTHLTQNKDLRVELGSVEVGLLRAPAQMVETAVANLLRNAIENSDQGVIRVDVHPAGVVRILDPGHGMSPADISKLYSSAARAGEPRTGAGLGLELIGRMCEHLGWQLELTSQKGQGTLAVLDIRASLVPHDHDLESPSNTPFR